VTSTRFSKATGASLAAIAIALSGTFFTAAAAGAQTTAAATPSLMQCTPPAGTNLSTKAVGKKSAWLPTNVGSSFLTGPGTITESQSATSQVAEQVSATFGFDEGFLFASVKEQYGVSLQHTHSQTQTWSYSKEVPKNQTLRVQQYHQSYEIGIRDRRMGYNKQHKCHVFTLTSLTGNYFPSASRANESYCYGLTPDKSSRVQVGFTCRDIH
jgi:hypothetical protein